MTGHENKTFIHFNTTDRSEIVFRTLSPSSGSYVINLKEQVTDLKVMLTLNVIW